MTGQSGRERHGGGERPHDTFTYRVTRPVKRISNKVTNGPNTIDVGAARRVQLRLSVLV
jgi:hypothetical protein